MTYLDYLNGFNQWLETNALPASSQLMFYKLLHVFNRAGWPEYVGVDNLRLMTMIGIKSKTTALLARDKLVEAGLIRFRRGKKGCPNLYALGEIRFNYCTLSDTLNCTLSDTLSCTHIKTKTKSYSPFIPPTVEEVQAYCRQRHNAVNPQRFVDYYTANGWMVGRNKMKDWQAAVRTWEKNDPPICQDAPSLKPKTGRLTVDENGEEVVLFD